MLAAGSLPSNAGGPTSVIGAGVICNGVAVGAPFSCGMPPAGSFTIAAREPGEGVVFFARSVQVVLVTLDCVVVERWPTSGSIRNVLFGSGLDVLGERWYVDAREGGGARSYLWLSQHDPGGGPCGALTGVTPLPPWQVARIAFMSG